MGTFNFNVISYYSVTLLRKTKTENMHFKKLEFFLMNRVIRTYNLRILVAEIKTSCATWRI